MHEWFKIKRYPHIGLPPEPKDTNKVISYITNSNKIAQHSFSPFIRRQVKSYRCTVEDGCERKVFKKKIRNLTYASHWDSAIFAYYGHILQEKYELYIREHQFEDVPTAYRRIPCNPIHPEYGNKCNIEIAKEVFDYIKSENQGGNDIAIITFDIKGFFDNLDHKILKKNWKKILGITEEMPKDLYQVYKHTTKFSYIHEDQLFHLFKNEIICKGSNGDIKKKAIKRRSYLRERGAIAFCERNDIKRIQQAHIIRTSPCCSKGIPQGLPISATLANVYMCDFDEIIYNEVTKVKGLYRRYSDDIIIVCPIEHADFTRQLVFDQIKNIKLEIEERKTNMYTLLHNEGRPIIIADKDNQKKELEYLGFSFDGVRPLIKKSGIEKHYHKMRKAQKRHLWYATHMNNATAGFIFENQILKRFGLSGSKRHRIRTRRKTENNRSIFAIDKNKGKTYGNYLTYAYKAAAVMNEDGIKKQLRRNLSKLITGNLEIKHKAQINTQKKKQSGPHLKIQS